MLDTSVHSNLITRDEYEGFIGTTFGLGDALFVLDCVGANNENVVERCVEKWEC
jgi:hypothetical protein